jgi:nucleoside-diphosphate-sugar epimerase
MSKYILNGLSGNVGVLLKDKFNNFTEYGKHLNITNEEVFVHIAAKSNGNYSEIIEANINYLVKIIKFCKLNKIKKIIFFSAISIYTKDDLYSTSKLLGEKILKESGLKVLVIRLPMILTMDKKNGILNRIIQKLENNEDVVLYNANKKFNNFISVDDIFNFINKYTFKKKYEVVNLATDNKFKLVKIVNILKKRTNSKSKIIINNEKVDIEKLSIKKAKIKYNYKPLSTKKILTNWKKIRGKKNENIWL